jgi:hypothetical protein
LQAVASHASKWTFRLQALKTEHNENRQAFISDFAFNFRLRKHDPSDQ